MQQGVRKSVSIPVFATTQCNGNEPGFGTRDQLGPKLDSPIAMLPWASHLFSLGLSFLIYKTKIIIPTL
jgi:hypothetical protein